MGYVSIANKLVELLDEVKATSDLAVVYDHDKPELGQYPAATVQAAAHQDRFHDTAANDRSFTFLIRLFYRLDDDQDAETILRDLADRVIQKIEANVTVPGVWEIAQPTSGVFLKDERELPVQIFELTVAIRSRVVR